MDAPPAAPAAVSPFIALGALTGADDFRAAVAPAAPVHGGAVGEGGDGDESHDDGAEVQGRGEDHDGGAGAQAAVDPADAMQALYDAVAEAEGAAGAFNARSRVCAAIAERYHVADAMAAFLTAAVQDSEGATLIPGTEVMGALAWQVSFMLVEDALMAGYMEQTRALRAACTPACEAAVAHVVTLPQTCHEHQLMTIALCANVLQAGSEPPSYVQESVLVTELPPVSLQCVTAAEHLIAVAGAEPLEPATPRRCGWLSEAWGAAAWLVLAAMRPFSRGGRPSEELRSFVDRAAAAWLPCVRARLQGRVHTTQWPRLGSTHLAPFRVAGFLVSPLPVPRTALV
jgi:hypothetical protein